MEDKQGCSQEAGLPIDYLVFELSRLCTDWG